MAVYLTTAVPADFAELSYRATGYGSTVKSALHTCEKFELAPRVSFA